MIKQLFGVLRFIILFPLVEILSAYVYAYFDYYISPSPVYSVALLTVIIWGLWYVLVIDHANQMTKLFKNIQKRQKMYKLRKFERKIMKIVNFSWFLWAIVAFLVVFQLLLFRLEIYTDQGEINTYVLIIKILGQFALIKVAFLVLFAVIFNILGFLDRIKRKKIWRK